MAPEVALQSLPGEMLSKIIEQLVITIGPFNVVKSRLVSKCFDAAILAALTTSQAIDFDDPALSESLWQKLPCSLRAKAMLVRSSRNSNQSSKHASFHFLAATIDAIDGLSAPAEGEQQLEQRHLMIAEAAAHFYSNSRQDQDLYSQNHNNNSKTATLRNQNSLCGAIVVGDMPLVQTLLGMKTIDVRTESNYFGLPLHLAAAWGRKAIVQQLLDHGADPRALSHGTENSNAIFEHSTDDRQAARSPKGSALRAAARGGHEKILELLLNLPPDQHHLTTSTEHFHAIIAAAEGGHIGCIELLVRATGKPLAELPSSLHEQMLWEAARAGQLGVVRLLLDDAQLRLDVDAQRSGRVRHASALHLAAARGDIPMVKLLLERYGANANLESWDNSVGYPYEAAARAGRTETLDALLTATGDEHAPVRAFKSAARAAQVGVLRWLVARYGRNISARKVSHDMPTDNDQSVGQVALIYAIVGQVALIYAIVDPAPDVIVFLVKEAGVSLDEGFRSLDGMLPVEVAKMESSRWVVDLLLRLGAANVEVEDTVIEGNRQWDGFTLETGRLNTIRGVRVSERTWQWV